MELGALGGDCFMEQSSFPSERQTLGLTAEELLRELVEEHRDPAFEYRSPQGFSRCGRWVGGAMPVEDNRTNYRFSTLALWCAQVSESVQLRLLPRVNACPVHASGSSPVNSSLNNPFPRLPPPESRNDLIDASSLMPHRQAWRKRDG